MGLNQLRLAEIKVRMRKVKNLILQEKQVSCKEGETFRARFKQRFLFSSVCETKATVVVRLLFSGVNKIVKEQRSVEKSEAKIRNWQ